MWDKLVLGVLCGGTIGLLCYAMYRYGRLKEREDSASDQTQRKTTELDIAAQPPAGRDDLLGRMRDGKM